MYAAYLTALMNRRQRDPEPDSWSFDSDSAPSDGRQAASQPTGSGEPLPVHSSLDEMLSDAPPQALRLAVANSAIELARPQDGGMFGPSGPLLSLFNSMPTSGGGFGTSLPRASGFPASPTVDFSSGFHGRPFNGLSAIDRLGDGHSQAWLQGWSGDDQSGQGTQFAENSTLLPKPPFAGPPAKSDHDPTRSSPSLMPARQSSSSASEGISAHEASIQAAAILAYIRL